MAGTERTGWRRASLRAVAGSVASRPRFRSAAAAFILSTYLVGMPHPSEIDLTVYPDECDAFGHLNQASFLSLFERARWELPMRGPGLDVFSRSGSWLAVRKSVIDYHAAAF